MHQQRARTAAGFSLLELMIVVALVGILAATILPSGNAALQEDLRAAARVLQSDVATCRSLAVTNNSHYRISFSRDGLEYRIEHSGTNTALDALPPIPFAAADNPPDAYVVRLADLPQIGDQVHLAAIQTDESAPQKLDAVEFGPLGELTDGRTAVLYLAHGQGAALRYLPLRINPVTGMSFVGGLQTSSPPPTAGMLYLPPIYMDADPPSGDPSGYDPTGGGTSPPSTP